VKYREGSGVSSLKGGHRVNKAECVGFAAYSRGRGGHLGDGGNGDAGDGGDGDGGGGGSGGGGSGGDGAVGRWCWH
jgi:hypothetical protein